jgi:hypothetical protein
MPVSLYAVEKDVPGACPDSEHTAFWVFRVAHKHAILGEGNFYTSSII